MSNMAYVRFENTLSDLMDCKEHLLDKLSQTEHDARKELVSVCESIMEDAAAIPSFPEE